MLLGLVYAGRELYAVFSLEQKDLPELTPTAVNLLGVDTSAGYYIVVANRVAQLVLGRRSEFAAPDERDSGMGDTGEKKRVPIRELLEALQGNEESLSRFVMVLNDVNESEFPPDPTVWKSEDLERALDGDEALKMKLEEDLNVKLDGTPLGVIRRTALESGILIESPLAIRVRGHGGRQERVLTARFREPFQPRFCREVYARYSKKDATTAMIAGYYREEANAIADDPQRREDVVASLQHRLDGRRLREYARVPEEVLNSVTVIVGNGQMVRASSRSYRQADGKDYLDLAITLTEEGRQRLWRYSRGRVGSQLLLVCRGVAVAAPRINHELSQSEVTITQLSDRALAERTVETVNRREGAGGR